MDKYKSLYSDLKFEREGLFQLVREIYPCREVLYPGCSIHIEPSFYFPHVVYVDQSEMAAQFFRDEKSILAFVSRNKLYPQSVYMRFIQQDYSTPLPLQDGSFGLLLALFAGGISKSCARYLKTGGILLTNNHQADALDAVHEKGLKLEAAIQFSKGKYRIVEADPDESKVHAPKMNDPYLKMTSRGMEYVDLETYYVFRRPPRNSHRRS